MTMITASGRAPLTEKTITGFYKSTLRADHEVAGEQVALNITGTAGVAQELKSTQGGTNGNANLVCTVTIDGQAMTFSGTIFDLAGSLTSAFPQGLYFVSSLKIAAEWSSDPGMTDDEPIFAWTVATFGL